MNGNGPSSASGAPLPGTIIGHGSELDGELAIQHAVRVDGRLKGRLATTDALVVGEEGVVEADTLEVGEAHISGRVSGHLMASRRVYLSAQSQFTGIVHTPHLVVEEGARLCRPEGREAPAEPAHT